MRRGVCSGLLEGHRDTDREVSFKKGGRDRSGGLKGRWGNVSLTLRSEEARHWHEEPQVSRKFSGPG